MLGDYRQDVNREAVGLREVDGVKLHPGFHQVRDERNVASEPIELGDDQRRTVKVGRALELRPTWADHCACRFRLPSLPLPAANRRHSGNRGRRFAALPSRARTPLPLCADTVVSHKLAGMRFGHSVTSLPPNVEKNVKLMLNARAIGSQRFGRVPFDAVRGVAEGLAGRTACRLARDSATRHRLEHVLASGRLAMKSALQCSHTRGGIART